MYVWVELSADSIGVLYWNKHNRDTFRPDGDISTTVLWFLVDLSTGPTGLTRYRRVVYRVGGRNIGWVTHIFHHVDMAGHIRLKCNIRVFSKCFANLAKFCM